MVKSTYPGWKPFQSVKFSYFAGAMKKGWTGKRARRCPGNPHPSEAERLSRIVKMKETSGFQSHSYFVRGIDKGLERELCEPFACIFLFGCFGGHSESSPLPPNLPAALLGVSGGFRSVC